jgi:hypothetical protein
MGKAPHAWGNYFSLSNGPRILNFWAENLRTADKQFTLNGKVRVKVYTDANGSFGLIDDQRIPKDWYYNKLCFTGSRYPTLDTLKDMYEYIGDPKNEIQQFTNPTAYHAKRGGKYNPATGIVSYNVNAKPRKLDTSWSIVEKPMECFISTDLIDELTNSLMKSILE